MLNNLKLDNMSNELNTNALGEGYQPPRKEKGDDGGSC